ncbi:hypothetical protein [Streptomyces sp. NPDC020983]|uniref:hypothetical protein n=1 Tax=Streptomyces sp. NPDC020983 TaxID=3365106 RepID=UPI00378DC09B
MTTQLSQFIAKYGPDLGRHLELDGLAAMEPEAFTEELAIVAHVWARHGDDRLREGAEELAAAVTYLRDAQPLPDSDPEKSTLLGRAGDRLVNIDAYL